MLKSVFQTETWSKFKEAFGWRVSRHGEYFGLERVLGFGRSMEYFPELPLEDTTEHIIGELRHKAVPNGRIFTRFEFLELWTPDKAKVLSRAGLIKAFEDVQPDHRQWVVLDESEEKMLALMKPKGRYNIKIAERHNLKIEWGTTDAQVGALADLYAQTAKRTGFAGRDSAYFVRLVAALKEDSLGEIVTVSHEHEVLAAALVTFYGGVASYLYGGSGGDRSLMAPYLMHWAAIKRAKQEGCAIYDLLAIAPPDKENHIHAGLTRFKTQFGGQSVRLLGSWDLVHNRFWYTIYAFAQKRRRRAL